MQTLVTIGRLPLAGAATLAIALLASPALATTIGLGAAANDAILFEGNNGNTLQITNVVVNGNVGVGLTGKATDSGPSTINGAISFAAAASGQFSNNNSNDVITGGVGYGVAQVASALSTVNALNSALGVEAGTALAINGNTTVNAGAGVLDANGYRVFTVTGFNTTNGNTLTINGDAAGDAVVFNFSSSANFNNQVVLNGLGADQVLYNFVGGSNLTGGPTLQVNDNASSHLGVVQGIFLDPNGAISITNADIVGRVFGGDTHDFQDVSGTTITAPAAPPSTPEPGSLALLCVGALPLLRRLRRRS